jgi:hypothetical protein
MRVCSPRSRRRRRRRTCSCPTSRARDGVYYDDCQDAVAQGTAPVLKGENGYREDLDADADGIGREWIPGDE